MPYYQRFVPTPFVLRVKSVIIGYNLINWVLPSRDRANTICLVLLKNVLQTHIILLYGRAVITQALMRCLKVCYRPDHVVSFRIIYFSRALHSMLLLSDCCTDELRPTKLLRLKFTKKIWWWFARYPRWVSKNMGNRNMDQHYYNVILS